MTVTEFKAWMDGFSHAIDGVPTKDQWEVIKKKVSSLGALSTTDLGRFGRATPNAFDPYRSGSPTPYAMSAGSISQ